MGPASSGVGPRFFLTGVVPHTLFSSFKLKLIYRFSFFFMNTVLPSIS